MSTDPCGPTAAQIFEELSLWERSLEGQDDCYWALRLSIRPIAQMNPDERPQQLEAVGIFEQVHTELGGDDPADLLWSMSFEFLEVGRAGEAASLARHGLSTFPGSHVEAALHALVAEEARQNWRIAAAHESLTLGKAALGHSRSPARDEVELLAPEVRLWIDQGLPDRAWEPLQRLREVVGLVPAEDRGVARAVLEELEISWLLATERYDEIIASLDLREGLSSKLRLDLAIALSERARLTSGSSARALELLTALHGDGALPPHVRWYAGERLAEIELRNGSFATARALIEAAAEAPAPDLNERLRFETLRARLELVANPRAAVPEERRPALKAALAAAIGSKGRAPLRSGGTGYLHFLSIRAAISELIALTLRQAGPEAALEELLAARELGTLARSLGGPPASLAAIRAELVPPGGGILAYLPGPERTHVFLIDARGVRCEELAAQHEWGAARAQLQRDLLAPPRPGDAPAVRADLDRLLAELAAALLPERTVQAQLRTWSEVVVEGLGPAGYVALEALPLTGGQALAKALPVSYLPSLSVGTRLALRTRSRPAPRADLSIVAAPLDPGLEVIPWLPDHTRAFARWCRPERLELRLGERATRAALLEPACMDASWLLLVLHGAYDPARERSAGFMLGHDPGGPAARLFAADVEALSVPPLVFLAICGAARGNLRSGDDGITDLGAAFLLSGAETVVLSPIDLEFEPTVRLAQSFQRELAQGASPAQAMHAARVELTSDPRFDHPYYYAPLHVVGLGRHPLYGAALEGLAGPRGTWPWWSWGGLAALVAGAALLIRRLSRISGSWRNRGSAAGEGP